MFENGRVMSLKPGTLVTEYFDWSVYDPMARICHHHLETCSVRQRLPSTELLTATGGNISSSWTPNSQFQEELFTHLTEAEFSHLLHVT